MSILLIVDKFIHNLASTIGKPDGITLDYITYHLDQIRLMLCMYMGYPLGFLLKLVIRGTTARHIFATVTGFIL
jgi:hypothetical protein